MKISKHLHSCLLVEDQGKVVLVDPGNYTADEHALDINGLKQLDAIVITHEHMDHMDIPFIKKLLEKFPEVQIYSTASVKEILAKENIDVQTTGNDFITMEPVPHERVWMGPGAQNVLITLFNKLATPGDSHTFTTHAEVLALPLSGPWASTTRAVELALELKPKVIIPIHDWHWKDVVRKFMYQRLKDYFAQHGIDFKAVETGKVIEV